MRPKRAQFSGLETTVRIVSAPNPVLRRKCDLIDLAEVGAQLNGYASLDALVVEMIATMRAVNGAGLAAPQIGMSIRLVVLDPDRTGAPFVMVNPILNGLGQAMKWDVESCLSCGDEKYRVRRRKGVSVAWVGMKGDSRSREFRGWAARVVQHELCHLDGELIADVGRRVKSS